MEPHNRNSSQRKQWMNGNPKDVRTSYSHSQSPPKDLSLGHEQHIGEVNNSSLTSQTSSLVSSFSMTLTPPSQQTKLLEDFPDFQQKSPGAISPDLSASPSSRKEWEVKWQQEQDVRTDGNVARSKVSNDQDRSLHGSMREARIPNPRSLPMHYEGSMGASNLDSYYDDGIAPSLFGVSPNISSHADDADLDNLLNSFDISNSVKPKNLGIAEESPPPAFASLAQSPMPTELPACLDSRHMSAIPNTSQNSGNGNRRSLVPPVTDRTSRAMHGTYKLNSICSSTDSAITKRKTKIGKEQHHTPSQIKAATSDKAVRGGTLFESVFKKKKSHKGTSSNVGNSKNRSTNMDQSNRGRRRTHSSPALAHTGSLDSSRRGKLYGSMLTGSESERLRSQDNGTNLGQTLTSILKPDKAIRGGSHFLIGPRNANTSLRPYQLAVHGESSDSSSKSNREQKLKFIEIHNSKDSAAAFLGDEKSGHGGNFFTSLGKENTIKANPMRREHSCSLTSVQETDGSFCPFKSHRSWSSKTGHLFTPAIINESHEAFFSMDRYLLKGKFDEDICHGAETLPGTLFGTHVLGLAKVKQVDESESCEQTWISSKFLLRQNYLLEYKDHDKDGAFPRSWLFLNPIFTSIQKHEGIQNGIEFVYKKSGKSRRSKKIICLPSKLEFDDWIECLKRAANLRIEDLYECGATIGEGHYSIIKRGKRRTDNGVRNDKQSEKKTNNKQSLLSEHLRYNRALKIIDKDRYWDLVMKKKERADSIVREVAVQATLLAEEDENEGFCRLLNFFETENNVVLELELLQGRDLLNYLLKSKGNVDESDAAHIMYDVLKCVVTMQERGIAHRDLKPANILMADMTKHGVVVKLSDFGMADFVGSDNLLRGRCGTPGFVAPEIYEAGVNVGYENHVDMFSAGTILYTLLCGYEPFIADTDEELKTENKRGKVSYPYECWKSVSIEGRDLVEKMLERDPKKRIEARKALSHPWIKRHYTNKV